MQQEYGGHVGSVEEKLRELVLLRSKRRRFLSTTDEEELLETAVTQLSLPLARANAIVIAATKAAGLELESDLSRAVEAMIVALAGPGKLIGFKEFELVAKYYSEKAVITLEEARMKLKAIVLRAGVQPAGSGFLRSSRWFRSIP